MKKEKSSGVVNQRERLINQDFSAFNDASPVEAFIDNDIITQRKIKASPMTRANFLIEPELKDDYMILCGLRGSDLSTEIRNFIASEVENSRELINQIKHLKKKV